MINHIIIPLEIEAYKLKLAFLKMSAILLSKMCQQLLWALMKVNKKCTSQYISQLCENSLINWFLRQPTRDHHDNGKSLRKQNWPYIYRYKLRYTNKNVNYAYFLIKIRRHFKKVILY